MTIVLLGPPGSGKGTQGALLKEHFGVPYIATGNIVREFASEAGKGNLLADEIRDRMVAGVPQPDVIINQAMDEKLATLERKSGIIFDAYPLSVGQAEGFRQLCQKYDFGIPNIVYLSVSLDSVLSRIQKRKFCRLCHTAYLPSDASYTTGECARCGGDLFTRPDDNSDVVRKRYEEYEKRMEALSEFYQAHVGFARWIEIDGEGAIDEVQGRILERLGVLRESYI